jgi:hypothetical protein
MNNKYIYGFLAIIVTVFCLTHISAIFNGLCCFLSEQNNLFATIFSPFIKTSLDINALETSISILTKFLNIIIGSIGLFLGIYYFSSRISYDRECVTIEKKNIRLNMILDQLNIYDGFVSSLLRMEFPDDISLEKIRDKIERSFELVQLLIENNDGILNLTDEDIKTVTKVNAYVDKCEIMIIRYLDIKVHEIDFREEKREYIPLIQDAKMVCLQNMR